MSWVSKGKCERGHATDLMLDPRHVDDEPEEREERQDKLQVAHKPGAQVLPVDSLRAVRADNSHPIRRLDGLNGTLAIALPNPFSGSDFAAWLARFSRFDFSTTAVAVGHIPQA